MKSSHSTVLAYPHLYCKTNSCWHAINFVTTHVRNSLCQAVIDRRLSSSVHLTISSFPTCFAMISFFPLKSSACAFQSPSSSVSQVRGLVAGASKETVHHFLGFLEPFPASWLEPVTLPWIHCAGCLFWSSCAAKKRYTCVFISSEGGRLLFAFFLPEKGLAILRFRNERKKASEKRQHAVHSRAVWPTSWLTDWLTDRLTDWQTFLLEVVSRCYVSWYRHLLVFR